MKDFFISYNRADKAWAEWIAWQLEKAGYSAIIQAWDFRPASNFVEDMQRATVEAERTIAVISPDYLSSEFARAEWDAAYAADPLGKKGKLLPVKVRECDLEGLRTAIVYIDLIGSDEEAAAEALIKGVSIERAKPTKEPVFPGQFQRPLAYKPQFPRTMPDGINLSLSRNPNFTGRDQILVELRAALISGQLGSWKQAIWGMGGVGKTQIANEYVYRHMADYRVIWWVRSEDSFALASDYAALANGLKLPEMSLQDQTKIIAAVKNWLEHNSSWLLVFDNVVLPQDIAGYLPRTGDGHVIVTSRNPNWGRIAGSIKIKIFDLNDSVQFIKKRTNQDEGARDLTEALGCLPLGLEQAGAYIAEKAISIPDYLERFQRYRAKILEKWDPKGPDDYPLAVAIAWDVSFRAVEETSKAAADLFGLCSFLAPENIPRNLFSKGSGCLPEPLASAVQNDLEFDNIVSALRNYSLIDADADTKSISVHRLVQLVTRDRMGKEDQRKWAGAAVDLVNDAFPGNFLDKPELWAECSVLLPHAQAASVYAEGFEVASEATSYLLNQVGSYLRTRGEFFEAKSALERALKIDEKVYGPDHPIVARDANNLGLILKDLGDLKGAKEHYERALKIDEKVYGPDHPSVALELNNLGMVLRGLGDLKGAKEHYERALKIDEKVYGPDHPDVAICINNIGSVLQDLGDLKGAKEYLHRALKIDEKVYGPNHPIVARDVNNIGLVLQDLGDLKGAKEYLHRALKIDEKFYGPNHPIVARDVNNLGMVLRDLGDLKGAKEYLDRALKIDEKFYGPNHPDVARDVNNLGITLYDLGDLKGAKEYLDRALKIDETVYGPSHPKVAIRLKNIGMVLRDLGDLKGAREYLERALKIDEKVYGPNHPIVARDVNNLGRILQALGNLQEARKCYERALKACREKLGDDHPHTKLVNDSLNSLGPLK